MDMDDQIKILIVDDTEENRLFLESSLSKKNYIVDSVESGEKAIEHIDNNPHEYDFIFIDHIMGDRISFPGKPKPLDGIETCRELIKYNHKAIIVIYSHGITGNQDRLDQYIKQAYNAGAVRYIIREWKQDKQIDHFINQIKVLRFFKDQLDKCYDIQKKMPSLTRDMDVGTMLIDIEGKIWHTSPAMIKILGLKEKDLIKHINDILPELYSICQKELDKEESIHLLPIRSLNKGLRYLKIKTKSVMHEEKIIAYQLTINDITDSSYLKDMNINRRYDIIIRSICSRKDGFDHAYIYINEDNRFFLKACSHDPGYINSSYSLDETEYLAKSISIYKKTEKGTFYPKHEYTEKYLEHINGPFIQWPLMEGEHTIAFIIASGKNETKCNKGMIDTLEPYPIELRKILYNTGKNWKKEAEIETIMSGLEVEMSNAESTNRVLEILIDHIIKHTNSVSGHIRYLEKTKAVLLPFNKGVIPSIAKSQIDLYKRDCIASRVLSSGNEYICNDIDDNLLTNYLRREYNNVNQNINLKKMKSLYYIPLVFVGKTIGLIELFSSNQYNYEEYKVEIAKHISKKIAVALHDYIVRENEKQNEWFQMLVHDLRTPLGFITTFSKHLEKTGLSEIQQKLVCLIKQNSQRYDRIVNKLMSSSLIDYGMKSFIKERISLHELITDVIEMMQMPAKDFSIMISYHDNSDRKDKILADKESLVEVFTNLLDNAIKFTKSRGNTIDVTIEAKENKYIVSVKDTGIGISENGRQHIFEKFNRGDAEHGKISGTGMGLFVVKYIIEKGHGGHISVNSKINQGTTFIIKLPI